MKNRTCGKLCPLALAQLPASTTPTFLRNTDTKGPNTKKNAACLGRAGPSALRVSALLQGGLRGLIPHARPLLMAGPHLFTYFAISQGSRSYQSTRSDFPSPAQPLVGDLGMKARSLSRLWTPLGNRSARFSATAAMGTVRSRFPPLLGAARVTANLPSSS